MKTFQILTGGPL